MTLAKKNFVTENYHGEVIILEEPNINHRDWAFDNYQTRSNDQGSLLRNPTVEV